MRHKLTNPIAIKFYADAKAFTARLKAKADKRDELMLPTVKRGDPEFDAWLAYFRGLGWVPIVMTMALNEDPRSEDKREVTVPARWPQWFDPTFVEAA